MCTSRCNARRSKKSEQSAQLSDVIGFLEASGYRVICTDQQSVHAQGMEWAHVPHGAEDEIGDRPRAVRARWLRHAAAFVDMFSGFAWSASVPVVVISGFTHSTSEFTASYQVINWHACNGGWNDVRQPFDHGDYLWCPRHAGEPRQFECTRLITVEHVNQMIECLPGFGAHAGHGRRIHETG